MFCVCRSSNSLCKLHIAINFALAKMAAAMNSKTVAVSPSEAPEGCTGRQGVLQVRLEV